MSTALRLRILVEEPPGGVMVSLQRGKGSMGVADGAQKTDGISTSFELPVDVRQAPQGIKFSGPYVQQDSKGQFVYLRWGQSAGDSFSRWQRRTKIYLGALVEEKVTEAVANHKVLTLVLAGTAKDGGPACATVPVKLLD